MSGRRVDPDDDVDSRVEPSSPGDADDEEVRVVVPWRSLSAEALRGVLVEFVTREGTEYGESDVELDTKLAQLRRQLERGDVAVLWSSDTETVNLVTRRELDRLEITPGDAQP